MRDTANILDLGEIDSPLLVYGGTYSNLQATTALLQVADRMGIPPERRLHTGDIVAYCADAEATTRAVMAAGGAVVRGNCEDSFGTGAGDCGCGFETGSACDLLSRGWYAHADATLSADSRAVMASAPAAIRFRMAGRTILAIHGGTRQVNRFVFASDRAALAEELDHARQWAGADIVLGGHCGIPFHAAMNGGHWLNAGVVGMPANDGDPRTVFLVLTPERAGIAVRFHRLAYDHQAAAAAMHAAGLAADYARALTTGFWPNMDILPAAERAAAGRPLALPDVIIPAGPATAGQVSRRAG